MFPPQPGAAELPFRDRAWCFADGAFTLSRGKFRTTEQVRTVTMRTTGWAVLLWLGVAWSAWAEVPPERQRELQTLQNQLTGPTRAARTRLEAARMLLGRTRPEARNILLRSLSDTSNPQAQIAVAEAIAHDGGAGKPFIDPLIAMLLGEEPMVRSPAARALVSFRDFGVREKLLQIASDGRRLRDVRIATIEALQRVVTRPCIEVLIKLLGDSDPAVRVAAARSLRRMTNIPDYGTSRALWQAWRAEQNELSGQRWLEEMIDRQARAKMTLETESADLRERLVKVMLEIYNASRKPRRPAILAGMLKDPVADVRLLGAMLVDRMLSENEPVPPDLRQRIRRLLYDGDPRVRKAAALLEAGLADERTTRLLLGRLHVEPLPEVRVGLLRALGQLLPTDETYREVLDEIAGEDDRQAIAAAEALARMAQTRPLDEDRRKRAARALADRYRQAGGNGNGVALRESLLNALGVVGDGQARPIFLEALQDESGVIRLSAVGGLATIGATDAVKAIAPLMTDEDRGVRQAAASAVARLGGMDYVMTLVARSSEAVEPDPAVRRAAVSAVLSLCRDADANTLQGILDDLEPRQADEALSIELLRLLADRLRGQKSAKLPGVLLRLGRALIDADRPAEAVPLLAEALRLEPDNPLIFAAGVEALLAANDPSVGRVLAEQSDGKAFREAYGRLLRRLEDLIAAKEYSAAVSLGTSARQALKDRLGQADRNALTARVREASAARLDADREEVRKLLGQVLTGDVGARSEAENRLRMLGPRAVQPLLETLAELLARSEPDSRQETAILGLLRIVAPDLKLYPAEAEPGEKRLWIQKQLAWPTTEPGG